MRDEDWKKLRDFDPSSRRACGTVSIRLRAHSVHREYPGRPALVAATGTVSPGMEATPSAVRVTDIDPFIEALDAAGFDVREGQVEDLGFPVWRPGREICIDGVRVTAYEFPSEAVDVRSAITPDGFGISTGGQALAHVDW